MAVKQKGTTETRSFMLVYYRTFPQGQSQSRRSRNILFWAATRTRYDWSPRRDSADNNIFLKRAQSEVCHFTCYFFSFHYSLEVFRLRGVKSVASLLRVNDNLYFVDICNVTLTLIEPSELPAVTKWITRNIHCKLSLMVGEHKTYYTSTASIFRNTG